MGAELDKVESKLAPRTGRIDLGLYTRGNALGWEGGAYVDAEGRLTDRWSMFGRGNAGIHQDSGWAVEALAGLRYRW